MQQSVALPLLMRTMQSFVFCFMNTTCCKNNLVAERDVFKYFVNILNKHLFIYWWHFFSNNERVECYLHTPAHVFLNN